MRRLVTLLLLAAAAPAADWWEVNRDVTARLLDRDVGEWARELEAEPLPRDERGLLLRFQVLLRAGHLDHLPEVVDALAPVAQSCDAVDALIDRGCLDLARQALEQFAIVERDTVERFLRACGDAISEEWLEARVKANEAFFEPWFALRVRRGTFQPVLLKLAEGVRGQPADMAVVRRYLSARQAANVTDDPSWIADVSRPRLAVESEEVAHWFMPKYARAAVFFLERALAQPFTEEDERHSRRMLAVLPPGPTEVWFRDRVKAVLVRAYQQAGEAAKAQAVLEDLASKYPDGLPMGLSGLAGVVQRDSGARVIEGRIRAKEAERKDDYQYWYSRAEYFAGRKEDEAAIEAFGRAWSMAPPTHDKSRILDAYVRHLAGMGRRDADVLHDRAFTMAPAGSDYAYGVLVSLLRRADDHAAFPSPADERLWKHLRARDVWHDERELLVRMARRAADRPEFWRRARAVSDSTGPPLQNHHGKSHVHEPEPAGTRKVADPSRALALADAMIRLGDHRDAILVLRAALPRFSEARHLGPGRSLLFDALLRENDWKAAEEMVTAEDAGRLAQIAIAAARAGEHGEALRIWGRRANLDRLSPDGVAEMIKAVGKAKVAASYEAISIRDRRFRVATSLRDLLGP